MTAPNTPEASFNREDDQKVIRIDFQQAVAFMVQYFKQLIIGAVLGVMVGLGVWMGFTSYKAQATVPNFFGETLNLRAQENSWADIALGQSKNPKLTSEDQAFYEMLASLKWWSKVLTPDYSITKADLKDLVGTPEVKGSSVLSLKLQLFGDSASKLSAQVLRIVQFMKDASVYNALNILMNVYSLENFSASAAVVKDIDQERLFLNLATRRLANLEELQKRFPNNAGINYQVIDSKESVAKYLPINTQIIAAKSDIFDAQEKIQMLQERVLQNQLMGQFIASANSILAQGQLGRAGLDQFLALEQQLRSQISANALPLLLVVDRIRLDLTGIDAQYYANTQKPVIPMIERTMGWGKASMIGLICGLLAALLYCLCIQFWPQMREYTKVSRKTHADT